MGEWASASDLAHAPEAEAGPGFHQALCGCLKARRHALKGIAEHRVLLARAIGLRVCSYQPALGLAWDVHLGILIISGRGYLTLTA